MSQRQIAYRRLDEIEPALVNPKGHELAGIGASIARAGFVEPVILDERTGRLVGGHGRLEHLVGAHAAGGPAPDGIDVDADGMWLLPVVVGWASKSDADAGALLVALNRLPEAGGWDDVGLAGLLEGLAADVAGLGLAGSGFDQADLDGLLAGLVPPEPVPETPPADPRNVAARVSVGEIWVVGPHRVMCGDCRDPEHVARLVGEGKVNLAVTSPPYAEQRKYDESSGFRPIPPDEYVEWFDAVQANVAGVLDEDGSWLVNIKPSVDGLDTSLYVLDLVAAHVRRWGWHFATEFCWERNGVPKQPVQRLKNQFEPVYQFTKGRWRFAPDNVRHESDNVPISLGPGSGNTGWAERQGHHGVIPPNRRPRKNGTTKLMSDAQGTAAAPGEALHTGWAYPGNRLPTFIATHEATGHSAAFPVGLPEFFTMLLTDPGGVVLDPFCGSGSSILAAHNAGRIGLGMELSPAYCDVILDRLERHTGLTATPAP